MSGVTVSAGTLSSARLDQLAVLASFDPRQARDPEQLRPYCTELLPRDGQQEWMLRDIVRIDALRRIMAGGGWSAVRALSDDLAPLAKPSTLQTLLTFAIHDRVPRVTAMTEDELVAALRVGDWLEKSVSAAARPGATALPLPSGLQRDPIEARLAQLDLLRPVKALTVNGCIGRERELARLAQFASSPRSPDLLGLPTLQVFGIGGIGKSTLVAQFVLDLAEAPLDGRPVWAYLDLDRPTLSSYRPAAILRDLMTQAGAQLPEAKRHLEGAVKELVATDRGQSVESADDGWRYLLGDLIRVVHSFANGQLVVVLDTFEEAQREDDPVLPYSSTADRLFDLFRELSAPRGGDRGLELRLVISGRAPITHYLESTDPAQLLPVNELVGQDAGRLLRHLYQLEIEQRDDPAAEPAQLSDELIAQVVRTTGGSPLTLTLAARVLADEGATGLIGAFQQSQTLIKVRQEVVRGFLYHRILDHLGGSGRLRGSPLPDVARAALALRVITPDLLAAVVLPTIGRRDLDPQEWFAALRRERGLAYLSDAPGEAPGEVVRIRDELRAPALRALTFSQRGLVRQIHQAAVDYYARRGALPGAGQELGYHLAALGRDPLDREQYGFDPTEQLTGDLRDLPEVVRRQQVAPTSIVDEALRQRARERASESAALRAIADGQPERAAEAVGDPATWSATTTLYEVAAQVEEQRRQPSAAAAAGRRDVAAAEGAGDPERYAATAIRQALRLERLGRTRGAVDLLAVAGGHELLAGSRELQLQVQLNAMTLQERRGLDDDRWLAALRARATLTEMGGRSTDSALVRLLAATLGRDESVWIRAAVDQVGLGSLASSSLWLELAASVAAWDAALQSGGATSLAVAAGLTEKAIEPTDRAWSQLLTGSSVAAPALIRLWALAEPPTDVLEAVRRFYVWWGIDTNPREADIVVGEPVGGERLGNEPSSAYDSKPFGGGPHFLDGLPLDFADPRLQELIRLLTRAYPRTFGLLELARRSGIDPALLPASQQPELVVRELLANAAKGAAVPQLIDAVLTDPEIGYLHPDLRHAVGETWLTEHGL